MSVVLTVGSARRVYGQKAAVDGASLTLTRGRITCLLGPSGCGKSTLLRLIAGLEPIDGGEIRDATGTLSAKGVHVPPERRDMGFVFQDYALFPHLTVGKNVGFGLTKLPGAEQASRIAAELERVRLAGRADSYPQALSGGEQQRIALARALARRPAVILLDEPFSGLDGRLKTEVRDTTLHALREEGGAALIVTHDAEEAMMMADDLVLMDAGKILQAGAPRDLYARPTSPAAAHLLGDANLLAATSKGGVAVTAFGETPGKGSVVMVRPEGLIIGNVGETAKIVETAFAGATVVLTLEAGEVRARARVAAAAAPAIGQTVKVRLDPAFCAVFA